MKITVTEENRSGWRRLLDAIEQRIHIRPSPQYLFDAVKAFQTTHHVPVMGPSELNDTGIPQHTSLDANTTFILLAVVREQADQIQDLQQQIWALEERIKYQEQG